MSIPLQERLDAVEIKVNIGAADMPAAAECFGLANAEKRRRTIYFCEDLTGEDGPAGLPLLTGGVILRLRRNKGRPDDITAKLRPCAASQLTRRWIDARRGDGWEFRVEGDWAGPRRVVSASLVAEIEEGIIEDLTAEGLPIPLAKKQRRFLEDCARAPVDLSRLTLLGPIDGTKWELDRKGREIVAEQWAVGDGLRFLEFSIRTRPEDAVEAQRDFEELFRAHGIDPGSVRETKTRIVLEHLARSVRPSAERGRSTPGSLPAREEP